MANKNTERHRVSMSFSPSEYKWLIAKTGGAKPAAFCKSVIMNRAGAFEPKKKKRTEYDACDPELLRHLSAIGNNLNQITRLAHSQRQTNQLELISIAYGIDAIKTQLDELLRVFGNAR